LVFPTKAPAHPRKKNSTIYLKTPIKSQMAHKINHRQIGEGPVLVLLHGYGGSVRHWDAIVKKLKDKFTLVVLNLSHLSLSNDKTFFSVQVELLAKFLKTNFPNQKVNIAGTSYGATLAWALAVDHQELVERLVMINPMVPGSIEGFVPPEIRYFFVSTIPEKSLQKMLATPIGKALMRRFAVAFREERTRGIGAVERLQGTRLEFVGQLIHRFIWTLKNEDWKSWGLKVQAKQGMIPSMMIYDREDSLFKPETYKDFAEMLGCNYIHEITGAGHLAITSRPDTISNYIEAFIPAKPIKSKKKSAA
jgi:pimeloyl-ACP methyl ester carboxylesterase